MKVICLPVLSACLFISYDAFSQEWKNECVGYYQLELPDNLEVALYPVEDVVNPGKQPESDGGIKTRLYASPKITFGKTVSIQDKDSVQAQFTEFYYGQYKLGISSQARTPIDWLAYKRKVAADMDFRVEVARQYEERNFKSFDEPVTPKIEFNRKHDYLIKDYPDAFTLYVNRTYSLYINEDEHLYHFWRKYQKDTGDKSQTVEKQLRDSEPEILSLLNRFRPRKLYEVPKEQGFCLPYGFIAGDSGHEPRNMGVTYRLKEHPDVTIFFQDFGMNGEMSRDKGSMKEAVTHMWNNRYLMGAKKKELLSPKWKNIKMDNREGMATFVKATYSNVPVYDYKGHVTEHLNYIDYGYLAYIRGDKENRNEVPDLLLYVSQNTKQLNGKPPMGKDELKKLAEHIASSVKRR